MFPILEPSSLLPPHTIPLGHPSAPASSIQYPASNLDWRFVSYMILYIFNAILPRFHFNKELYEMFVVFFLCRLLDPSGEWFPLNFSLCLGYSCQNTVIGWDLWKTGLEWKFMCMLFMGAKSRHSVVSDSLQPHGLQHARPPCPSPTPGAYSNSWPLSR